MVVVRTHERHQVGNRLESVQVFILAQERFPLVAGIAPALGPQRVAVTVGQAQADRHEVGSHAAQNNEVPSANRMRDSAGQSVNTPKNVRRKTCKLSSAQQRNGASSSAS